MMGIPQTPTASLATGPVLTATRSWIRAESRWARLCRSSAEAALDADARWLSRWECSAVRPSAGRRPGLPCLEDLYPFKLGVC